MRASVGAWLAVAAAAARSFDGAIDHAGREQVIHFFRGNSSARYFSIVEAWGGEIVVFAKEAVPGHRGHEHDRVSFWTNCRGVLKDRKDIAGRCFRAPIKHLTDYRSARDANWAHNTASLFEDGVLHMIGGRDGRRRVAHHHVARDGVYRFGRCAELDARAARVARDTATLDAAPHPTDLAPAFYGNHSNCTERRPHFAPNCEFDGRFSLARHGDKVLAFARANVVGLEHAAAPGSASTSKMLVFGGRFVQVAAAPAAAGPFGPFALLRVAGYAPARDANIYFASVGANPADADSLLALFPVLSEAGAAIAVAASCDGERWSALAVLANTTDAGGGRTLDHPADGWLVDGATGTVYFFLHRNVPFIREDEQLGDAAFGPRSALTRVPVALATLAAFTERHLPGGCGR
ncbi:ligase [Aureococcus anophagefferens]|nr:ligase [Aureococcus anophagefferens]